MAWNGLGDAATELGKSRRDLSLWVTMVDGNEESQIRVTPGFRQIVSATAQVFVGEQETISSGVAFVATAIDGMDVLISGYGQSGDPALFIDRGAFLMVVGRW